MQMTKPFFGKLRRTYSPGIWLHCRKSATLGYLQGYIHRIQVRTVHAYACVHDVFFYNDILVILQVDNQLSEATFPVVLYSNLHKTFQNYAGNCKLKHCLEFSYLKQRKLRNTIYKYVQRNNCVRFIARAQMDRTVIFG